MESLEDSRDSISAENISTANTVDGIITTCFFFQVLKWVEEAVQASKVHLLSTDHLTMAVNTWQIPFDPSLKEVTVSLSGPSPAIEIHDPLGEVVYAFFCNNKKR